MLKHLVITALGDDRPGIVNELSKEILDKKCNIVDSRMAVLGEQFAIIMLVSGKWDKLAKLESSSDDLGNKLGLTISTKYTQGRKHNKDKIPYIVEAVTIDQPGVVNSLASFFSDSGINIESINTSTYNAAITGAQMFSAQITVNIATDIQIAQLREDFFELCDDINLDATFEPLKGSF
ncbi:MAG: glycine cleavage system protein R [Gammaproteobacteria bacterium]|nr:MAG: glycine cleavage system protein R [Gammaproteobacteria bacterium]